MSRTSASLTLVTLLKLLDYHPHFTDYKNKGHWLRNRLLTPKIASNTLYFIQQKEQLWATVESKGSGARAPGFKYQPHSLFLCNISGRASILSSALAVLTIKQIGISTCKGLRIFKKIMQAGMFCTVDAQSTSHGDSEKRKQAAL